jgi:ankyrin repeat protein
VKIGHLLIDHGADVNIRDEHLKRTPLHWAATPRVAKLLIDHGADVTAKDKFRKKPLSYARQENREALVALLRDAEKKHTHAERVAERRKDNDKREIG